MTDEDESTNPGIVVAAERAILKFLKRPRGERGRPGRPRNVYRQPTSGASGTRKSCQTNEDRRRIGGNDPPRLEPNRGLSEAGRQGDHLRSQPMELSADIWRRCRPCPQSGRATGLL